MRVYTIFLGLFLTITIGTLNAQIKGSYWFTMQTEFRSKVENSQNRFFLSNELEDRIYQTTRVDVGYFLTKRAALGGALEWHNGVDFKGPVPNSFFSQEHNGQSVHGAIYLRNYIVNKRRFLLTSEIGTSVDWNAFDWSEEYIDQFSNQWDDWYYGPKRLSVNLLTRLGFGIRINENTAFLLNLSTEWSIYSKIPVSGNSGEWRLESSSGGLGGRIEYYFSHPKRVLYQRFQKPFEQKRSYWEADGQLFARNREEGLGIKVAYGKYYPAGFSTRFWVQLNNEYRLMPLTTKSSVGAAIQKYKRLKKLENAFWVWGVHLAFQDVDDNGFYFKVETKTMLEHWSANRVRFAVGSTAAFTFYEARYEWMGRGEAEYFFSPNFSWQASVALPIMQNAWSEADRNSNTSYQRWEGNTTELAARIWF